MAYELGPDGLPRVNGLALPLTPDQLAAAGVPPAQAPGGIPMPPMQNPYGGLPPSAVAGPGGAPVELSGGPDASVMLAAGNGQGPQLSPVDLSRLQNPQPTSRAHEAAPSRADSMLNAGGGSSARRAPEELKPIPTVGEAQQAASSPGLDPIAAKAMEWELSHSGGGGPRRLAETGESQKYTQYGAVPDELARDINARQEALDKSQIGQIQQQYSDQGQAIDRERKLIEQQQRDARDAAVQRQIINQRINQLQAHSDAQEAALVQAKPKEISEYWGGNMMAQMLGALSIALGAGVQTRTGHNPGAEIVNGAIDRWVNDQKQQYEAAKDRATVANNKYKDAIDMFGTPEAAEAHLRLQGMTASNALAQNMAEQSKNQQWLTNAQLMQQSNQLQRQQAKAASIQQAGMREIDSKLAMVGGAGSGGNPYVRASKAGAEVAGNNRIITGTTNEDRRTQLEQDKAEGVGRARVDAASDAAEAVGALQEQTKSIGGRTGAGAGDTDALVNNAENKFAVHLQKSGVPPRAALAQAKEAFKGVADKIRTTGHADEQLSRVKAIIEGDARKASVRRSANVALGQSDEVGEPE